MPSKSKMQPLMMSTMSFMLLLEATLQTPNTGMARRCLEWLMSGLKRCPGCMPICEKGVEVVEAAEEDHQTTTKMVPQEVEIILHVSTPLSNA